VRDAAQDLLGHVQVHLGPRGRVEVLHVVLARMIHEDWGTDENMQTEWLRRTEERRARHCRWKPREGFHTFPRCCAAGKAGRLRTRLPSPSRRRDEMRPMNRTG
jgi:hypothetical protein